jgi:hypothetical protein
VKTRWQNVLKALARQGFFRFLRCRANVRRVLHHLCSAVSEFTAPLFAAPFLRAPFGVGWGDRRRAVDCPRVVSINHPQSVLERHGLAMANPFANDVHRILLVSSVSRVARQL